MEQHIRIDLNSLEQNRTKFSGPKQNTCQKRIRQNKWEQYETE